MKGKKTFQPLTSEHICGIYSLLHKEGLISFEATPDSRNKIDALVANINGSNFSIANYATSEEKVVAYLYFMIKNHPFVDGNKRTAVLAFTVLCALNDLHQNLEGYDLDALAIYLESIKNVNHQTVIKVLAKELFGN